LVIGLWSNTRTGNLACRPHSANPGLKRTCGQLTRSPRWRGRGSTAGW
jgi:hypothetical protein